MTEIVCPICLGKGHIDDVPVQLSRLQHKIFDVVRRAQDRGATVGEIAKVAYADRVDGGPQFDHGCIYVTITHINRKLGLVGQKITSTNRGRGARYRLQRLIPDDQCILAGG